MYSHYVLFAPCREITGVCCFAYFLYIFFFHFLHLLYQLACMYGLNLIFNIWEVFVTDQPAKSQSQKTVFSQSGSFERKVCACAQSD